jgi:hypothetical protein
MLTTSSSGQDHTCKIVFAVGMAILVFMVLHDYVRSHQAARDKTGGAVCSLKNKIQRPAAGDSVSAKRGNYAHARSQQAPTKVASQHMQVHEAWPYQPAPEREHVDKETNFAHLYVWDPVSCEGKQDVEQRFEQAALDKEKVKKNANIRSRNLETRSDTINHSRSLGMENPVHKLYRARGAAEEDAGRTPSSSEQIVFNQSEAHFAASMRKAAAAAAGAA